MSEEVSTAIILAVVGLQSFWIKHALDGLGDRIGELRNDVGALRTDVQGLDRRVARLEGREHIATEGESE